MYAARNRPRIIPPLLLLYVPPGLFLGYVLYLLRSRKGAVVFSPEYRAVIEKTPHVRYKQSRLVWGFVVLLVIVFGGLAITAGFR